MTYLFDMARTRQTSSGDKTMGHPYLKDVNPVDWITAKSCGIEYERKYPIGDRAHKEVIIKKDGEIIYKCEQ